MSKARKRETLAEARAEFKAKCVPSNAGPEQRIETDRAFMAGAVVMYALMMAATRHEDDNIGAEEMAAILTELNDYAEELARHASAESASRPTSGKPRES